MNASSLHETSDVYYQRPELYDVFCQCEDAENKVFDALLPEIKNKEVLDVGCGTGKYLRLFAPHAKHITGVDASDAQLKLARKKTDDFKNVEIICENLENFSSQKKFDVVIGCWVLGTILDINRRKSILSNLGKLLNDNGCIYLVENDEDSEFEMIRGRTHDPEKRTLIYNHWLQEQMGFTVSKRLTSHFQFNDLQHAQEIIGSIYGKAAALLVKARTIEHKIIVFKFISRGGI